MTLQGLNDVYRIRRAVQSANITQGSKKRIYDFFQSESDKKKRAAFLKEVYHTMGGSYGGNLHFDFDSKGICVKRNDWSVIATINWTQLEKFVDSFIFCGVYMKERDFNDG